MVALGITTDGVKIPLGLWDGSTENETVASALLSDLVARGLDVEQGVLVVIDGSKANQATPELFGLAGSRCAGAVEMRRARSPRCPGHSDEHNRIFSDA